MLTICSSCSCVAVCDTKGNVHILKDRTEFGESATVPSVLAFSQSSTKLFIGQEAVSQVMAPHDGTPALRLNASEGCLQFGPACLNMTVTVASGHGQAKVLLL